MRTVVVLAVVLLLGAIPVACGGPDESPTPGPAGVASSTASPTSPPAAAPDASPDASPTSQPTTSQPPSTNGSGQLAFAGRPEGASTNGVYLVGGDGAGLEAIWNWEAARSHAVYLAWSPDGRQLAFFGHDASAGTSAVFVLDADEGSVTRLLESEGEWLIWHPPVWSPDGSQVYLSLSRTPLRDGGIWAVPADGSADPTLLAAEPEMASPLTISPDGRQVAASIGGPPRLAVMSVDESQMQVIVDDLILISAPIWSPDSQQIAFIAQPSGSGSQLYVVNADGTDLRPLTDIQPPNAVAAGFAAGDPVWSPDGQQIAFLVNLSPTPETAQTEVFIASVDGSEARNLTNDRDYVDVGPSWSADGQELAFISQPADDWRNSSGGSENRAIRVIAADGTNLRTVVEDVQAESYMELIGLPRWRPTAE